MTTRKKPSTPRKQPASAAAAPGHWLVKSEPGVFSYGDLEAAPRARTSWDGVRNYQARNFMRDKVRVGDPVLFYHSSASPPSVVGVARVASAARPDATQFDPAAPGHDPRSSPEDPRWWAVELEAVAAFPRPVPLADLRANGALGGMALLQRGQRLSVMPVTGAEFREVLRMGGLRGSDLQIGQGSA